MAMATLMAVAMAAGQLSALADIARSNLRAALPRFRLPVTRRRLLPGPPHFCRSVVSPVFFLSVLTVL